MLSVRRLFIAAAGLLALHAPWALAQSNPSLTAIARGIDDGRVHEESGRIHIDAFRVTAHVQGRLADVTLDLQISTAGKVADEARIALAMPADAVVTGYALDVGGRMIAGELIDQPRARNVYEDQVRAGIDPGFAEVTAENMFRTRVFPLMPGQPRRLRITFTAPFDPAKGLVLPLASADPVGYFELSMQIDGYAEAPVVMLGSTRLSPARQGGQWVVHQSSGNQALSGALSVAGGKPDGTVSLSRHASGDRFFQIADGAVAPASGPIRNGRLRVYWDRSLSRRDDLLDKERELLGRMVARLAPSAMDLIGFASDQPRLEHPIDAAALDAALGRMTYRGATSFAGLDSLRLADADTCVLFTDGQTTIDQAADFAPDCRLAVVSSTPDANGAKLGALAQASGGQYVRLTAENVAAMAERLTRPTVAVVSARDEQGRRLAFRSLPAPDGSWLLVGKVPDTGPVVLRIAGLGNGIVSRTYDTMPGDSVRIDAPGSLWAAQKAFEFGEDPDQHEQMVAFSRKYRVAGPQMAFLVLETQKQYLDAEIEPPADFGADWLKSYREAKATQTKARDDARAKRFEFVLGEWQRRKEWWNTRFTPAKHEPHRDTDRDRNGAGEGRLQASTPPPPPPPAPRDVRENAPTALARQDANGDIVTTARRAEARASGGSASSSDQERGPANPPRAIKLELGNVLSSQPYIAALEKAAPADRMKVFAEEELKFGNVPAFYIDVAEWFRSKGENAVAMQLLLSALELPGADDETRQLVAFRLERELAYDRAVPLFERVAAGSSFRPQPRRDLALALAERGRARGGALGRNDLERAFRLLTDAALEPAIGDFDGIEVVSLMEANALIPAIEAAGGKWTLDPRLVALLDTDVRIVIEWSSDDADIDLWVDEPNGERVYYGDKLSSAGGQISNDMTDGYGPEEYAIRRAPTGDYSVRVNGFDADRINPNGRGHVLIRLIRNFGRANATQTLVDVDLSFQKNANRNEQSGTREVAKLQVGPSARRIID